MKTLLKAVMCIVLMCLFVGTADAGFTYSFVNITGNSATNAQVGEDQLAVEVSDSGSSQVLFNFTNSGPEDCSITQIYFEDSLGLLDDVDSLIESSGVDFVIDSSPGNLPGGNTISFVENYEVKPAPPVAPNGINPGESLGVVFNLADSFTYDDIIASLDDGFMRIGMHVQSFSDEGSESFVNNGRDNPVIPAPGAISLALVGISIARLLRKGSKTKVCKVC
jgi:hypothetical protein